MSYIVSTNMKGYEMSKTKQDYLTAILLLAGFYLLAVTVGWLLLDTGLTKIIGG